MKRTRKWQYNKHKPSEERARKGGGRSHLIESASIYIVPCIQVISLPFFLAPTLRVIALERRDWTRSNLLVFSFFPSFLRFKYFCCCCWGFSLIPLFSSSGRTKETKGDGWGYDSENKGGAGWSWLCPARRSKTRRVKKAEAIGESYMKVARIYTCIHAFRCCCCFCCCCCYDMRRESASIRPSISVCASLRENIENSFTANDGRFTQLAITMTFFFLRRNWLCG